MGGENWTSIDTSNETTAQFKARRQLERRFERWAWICDSHQVQWTFRGGQFHVRDCWPVNDDYEGGPWQTIETTAQLWQALGY